jgi:hypothetical protein
LHGRQNDVLPEQAEDERRCGKVASWFIMVLHLKPQIGRGKKSQSPSDRVTESHGSCAEDSRVAEQATIDFFPYPRKV